MFNPYVHCPVCGNTGKAKIKTKGSFLVELAVWFFTIPMLCIPGVIYTLWRVTSGRVKCCRYCGNEMVTKMHVPPKVA